MFKLGALDFVTKPAAQSVSAQIISDLAPGEREYAAYLPLYNGVESLAGIMGGEHSGCDAGTTDVLIESALWVPINIAQTGRKLGIVTLVDGAQSAGHLPVDVQAIGCDFFAFSGHKICGPTGIGALYGRQEILETMPPYQGGGEMILTVGYDKTEFKHAPHRFEAGTPDISGPIGLHAAMDYLDAIGRENIWQHDQELAHYAYDQLAGLNNIRLFGPKKNRAGLVSFLLKDVHAHDVVTLADQGGVALRGGHHCTQPLMHKLGVESTARASFYFYNTKDEVDRFIDVVKEIQKFFGA